MAEVVVKRILDPETWKKRQLETLKAVGEANYSVGITFPKHDPIKKGIEKEKKYAQAMKKVIEEQRRKKGLEFTDISEWYAYSDKFKGRLVEGVVIRENEVAKFVDGYNPILLDHLKKIDPMPDVTDREREEKMLENLRGLKAIKGKWRRR